MRSIAAAAAGRRHSRRFVPLLYSLTHKFIFIHVPKTAGLSITRLLRPASLPSRPRSQFRRVLSKLPIPERPEKAYFPMHTTARWSRLKYGAERFDAFYTFALLRNPYDLFVSRYNFILNGQTHHNAARYSAMSFLDFARVEKDKLRFGARDQTSMLDDGSGRIIVRNLFRFENLEASVSRICADIGVSPEAPLPRAHVMPRAHYSSYYSDESRAIVETIYGRDLKAFGYEFDRDVDPDPVVRPVG
ncbi:sulfotransferase family 2 domain-containing protein [Hoeflea marina]|uniref:sulfotransferase family 2 domain-containing protein n=1 Tax=Hoeflea marina TaxID=274592 RepID=UPI001304D6FA|nr:sulfotransferase family 2 domain-containing protein [Hoeflea marina]